MPNTHASEAYIVNRYKLWERWQTRYDYKHVKGARIVQIITETGGPVPLALEIGVGPGGVAAAVSRRGMKIIGIDLSSEAILRAKEHCRAENVALMRASGFSLPFRDQSLALVYASQVLHLFDSPDRLSIMREVGRVLQPGGRFVFDMKNVLSHPVRFFLSSPARRHTNFPRKAEILGLLREAGFSSLKARPGVLPIIGWATAPNLGLCRALAHTTFFVATRPAALTN